MNINEIMHDFRRRWEQGFVWVEHPESKEESLFYVDRIADDQIKVGTIELSSPEYGKILLNMGTAHTLKFKYPPIGVYQNGMDAYIFRRRPERQYKHGIYHGNSSITLVHHKMTGRVPRTEALKFDDVLAAFNGEKYPFAEALRMLGSGIFRSVALQRNWSLCLSPVDKESYVLLYWDTPVGTVDRNGVVLHIYEKQFESVIEQVKGN